MKIVKYGVGFGIRFWIPVIFLYTNMNIIAQGHSENQFSLSQNQTDSSAFVQLSQKEIDLKSLENPLNSGLVTGEYLSGNWGGIRDKLEQTGISLEFVYKGDLFSNVYGGFNKGTKHLHNIDLIFSADLGKSLNLHGSSFALQILGNEGGMPSELVGASQGISNIETIPAWKIYQVLLENKFFEEKLSLLVGLYDLNSEFDVRETSAIFINPSHGIGDELAKSGTNGPSIFPTTSAAIRLKYETNSGNYIQAVVLDGVPGNPNNSQGTQIIFNNSDGLLLSAEYGFARSNNERLDYKIGFGGWLYTSKSEVNNFNSFETETRLENNYGIYFTSEKQLYSSSKNTDSGIVGFLRVGYANPNVNPVDYYIGTGLKFSGLIGQRENDVFGIALAFTHNSSSFRSACSLLDEEMRPNEINIEATYLLQLTPWLIIQPDIQYIINPSYCIDSKSAVVIGTRFEVNF